ncbi:tetratricopeptide (TPR) repeat protein [Kutzneria viridogrisea]|uniref:Tetratricopeptide (TPR) repeat protein n=1 Tax=Kutzneria viridogrisea TaxID=47990 RepID=A0ABR6BV79_9PSEU|nr:tetratricopeptide (TPR) repeat protein [Kutzneria viridogrisea]
MNNVIVGPVTSPFVQAGVIHGGVTLPGRSPVLPRQLPPRPSRFTGRKAELAELTEALDAAVAPGATVVISAVHGVGGIGKTFLALHWAHENVQRFPDGQLFVNLQGFDPHQEPMAPERAVRGFLDALGVAPQDVPAELHAQVGLYRSLVADRRVLIVLDNARDCEQVNELLPGSKSCTVLVTSRDQVEGLAVEHEVNRIPLGAFDEEAARALLALRLPEQRLQTEPAAVDALIKWCAGLPLALNILAGRVASDPHISLTDLVEELHDTPSPLSAVSAGTRSTSLEAVLSGSYKALTSDQARVFRLVGVAPGADISTEAAASLAGAPKAQVRRILLDLQRVSLVQHEGQGRYSMHDLVRLYAAEQAARDAESDEALQRLVHFCCHSAHDADLLIAPDHARIDLGPLADGCTPQSFPSRDKAWEWFTAERANLMATQHLAVEKHWHAAVWQLAWTCTTFNLRQGHLNDNQVAWMAGARAAQHLGDPRKRTQSYRHLGRACAQLGLHVEAIKHLQEGLAGAERDGDVLGQAHTHRAVAVAWAEQGDNQRALEHSHLALQLYRQVGSPSAANALNEVGWYNAQLGKYELAREHCTEALALCRGREKAEGGQAKALTSLGYIAYRTGDSAAAVDHYEQALLLYQNQGDTSAEADVHDHLASAIVADDQDRARKSWNRALELYQAQDRTAEARRVQQRLADLTP